MTSSISLTRWLMGCSSNRTSIGFDMAASIARCREPHSNMIVAIEGELLNLSETAARGGAVPAVLQAIPRRDEERRQISTDLPSMTGRAGLQRFNRATVRKALRTSLDNWRGLLTANIYFYRAA